MAYRVQRRIHDDDRDLGTGRIRNLDRCVAADDRRDLPMEPDPDRPPGDPHFPRRSGRRRGLVPAFDAGARELRREPAGIRGDRLCAVRCGHRLVAGSMAGRHRAGRADPAVARSRLAATDEPRRRLALHFLPGADPRVPVVDRDHRDAGKKRRARRPFVGVWLAAYPDGHPIPSYRCGGQADAHRRQPPRVPQRLWRLER